MRPEHHRPVDLSETQHVTGPKYTDMLRQAQTDEAKRAEQERHYVRPLNESKLPYYESAPLHLDPITTDPRYQDAIQPLEPLRQELDQARERFAELNATGEYSLERTQLAAKLSELEAAYQQSFDPLVRPILAERQAAAAQLPHYNETMAMFVFDLTPVGLDDRIDYGYCEVEVDRIVSVPSLHDWSGQHDSKAEGSSDELMMRHALAMLRGDFQGERSTTDIKLRAALTSDNNYIYLLEDGSHRIGAAKLIGLPEIPARVHSYNYTASDRRGSLVNAEHRARHVPERPQGSIKP